jgi:7,8-dihydroneopterin aldolase/epimerase/oxygenase
MSDLIRVVDLEIHTRIGVPGEERAQPQRLLVTLEMSVGNVSAAAATDDIGQTVDYFTVAQEVKKFADTTSCKLIETFAEKLACRLLDQFRIGKIRLELKKFILKETAYVSVVIERTRR